MGGLPISCKGIDFDIMEDKVFIINRNGMKTEFSYFDVSNHIKDYVDIGYCSGMDVIQKDGREYLRVKFPKKEIDLREYFGYNEKKVSNDKDISGCNPKYLYYDDILNMDEEEVDSYLCGLISANCSVNVSKLIPPLPAVSSKASPFNKIVPISGRNKPYEPASTEYPFPPEPELNDLPSDPLIT